MIEIKIEKNNFPIYCIKCGIQTVSSISNFINEGTISICPHLVYLGEGGAFDEKRPEYCKFYDELMQVGATDFLQTLREELNDRYMALNIASTTTPLTRYFVVYSLGELSKERVHFENCEYWNVWGSTVSKYLKPGELDHE